jgi:hypothetical protein
VAVVKESIENGRRHHRITEHGSALADAPVAREQDRAFPIAVLSGQTLAASLGVVGSSHAQPVSLFQQLAGGHPSGRADVREIPAIAAQY